MATFTDVQTSQIEQAAASIRQNIGTIRGIQNALSQNVLSKLAPHWQGEAKELFFQQFTALNASLDKLLREHEALNQQLEASAAVYNQADSMVMSAINRLPR